MTIRLTVMVKLVKQWGRYPAGTVLELARRHAERLIRTKYAVRVDTVPRMEVR